MEFKKGQKVTRTLLGPGPLKSSGSATIGFIDRKGVWLDNGPGNDPSGPFDPTSGGLIGASFAGMTQVITPVATNELLP